jgi:FkbM family methyltransferase
MSIVSAVKRLLKMCGHAFVGTVHERLDVVERELRELRIGQSSVTETANHMGTWFASLAETQTALLQAAVDNTQKLQALSDHTVVGPLDSRTESPEIGLMEFLYSYLPDRRAVDIGAHAGEVSECLLRSGYEVYAFEPNPAVFAKLIARLDHRPDFHAFAYAIGAEEGELPLHLAEDKSHSQRYKDATLFSSLTRHSLPDDIAFTSTAMVPVKKLADLHQAGVVPENIGIVKIDTEGFDLEVIRGMDEHRYPVVVAEFWDEKTPLAGGSLYTLDTLVGEMRQRGYTWHTVLHQVWMGTQRGFYSNSRRTAPNTWGNVFFFRDYAFFAQAQAWCSAMLPRTFFGPQG